MSDIRELVLDRLEEICDLGIIQTVARDRLSFGDSKLPAIAILEGDEELNATFTERRRPGSAPVPMTMVPEVCIVAINSSENLGPDLNEIRAAVIKAITSDAQLQTIIGNNGSIHYRGMISDLGIGRAMLGRMSLRFAINYTLHPDRL